MFSRETKQDILKPSPHVERSHIPHLVAKIDPRNKASERIIAKVGARKGEVLEKVSSFVEGGLGVCRVIEKRLMLL